MKKYIRSSRKPTKQDLINYYNRDGGSWSSARRYKATTMPRYSVIVSINDKLQINENYTSRGYLNYLPSRFDVCIFETNNRKEAQAYLDNIKASEDELISILENAIIETNHHISGPRVVYHKDHIVMYYTPNYTNGNIKTSIENYLLQDNKFSKDSEGLIYSGASTGVNCKITFKGGFGTMPMLWITRPFKAIPMDYTKGYSLD